MNRLVAQMLSSRWVAPVLLVVAAVSTAIVVSVRGGGLDHDHDPDRGACAVRTGKAGHGRAGAGVASARDGAGTRATGPRCW